jgi:hypothetical protein
MAVGKLEETSQHFVAGMTRVHIITCLTKVKTSATFQGPLLWSANTAEIYDRESEKEVRNVTPFTDCTVS